jgi:hypothetical protein
MDKCPRCGLPETKDPNIARRRAVCNCVQKAEEGMIEMGFTFCNSPKPRENRE